MSTILLIVLCSASPVTKLLPSPSDVPCAVVAAGVSCVVGAGWAAGAAEGGVDVVEEEGFAVLGAGIGSGFGVGVGLGWDDDENLAQHVMSETTLATMRTKKSFSFTPHDSIVLSSVRILPECTCQRGFRDWGVRRKYPNR